MFCREEGKRGGCAIYCKKHLKCKVRTKLNNMSVSGNIECAAVECEFGVKRAVIISIYRPPSGVIHIFMDIVEKLLTSVFNEGTLIFVAGDSNIELLKDNKTKSELFSLMNSLNLHPSIFVNTRISYNSSSSLDNIFTNCVLVKAYAFENYISDHTAQK